jgi:hypothetical protein
MNGMPSKGKDCLKANNRGVAAVGRAALPRRRCLGDAAASALPGEISAQTPQTAQTPLYGLNAKGKMIAIVNE